MNRTTVARMMLLEAARVFVQANPMRGDFISEDDPSLHALESAAVMLALGKEADAREKRGAAATEAPADEAAPPKEKRTRKKRTPKQETLQERVDRLTSEAQRVEGEAFDAQAELASGAAE